MKTLHLIAILLASSTSLLAQGGDECSNATAIFGVGPHVFDQTSATESADSSTCTFTREDVWFVWTASETMNHVLSTCGGTNHQTTLGVYDACGGTQLACGSSWCRAQSQVEFLAVAGNTYWFRIGTASNNGGGSGTFRIFPDRPKVNPSTGHAYSLRYHEDDWIDARTDANSQFFNGGRGHLATITSQAEQDWIVANFDITEAFIGLSQSSFTPGFSEPAGGWSWVTGEPLAFTGWGGSHPDDGSGSADYGIMVGDGSWEDVTQFGTFIRSHLVEWDAGLVGSTFCDPADVNSTGQPTSLIAVNGLGSGTGVRLEVRQGPPSQFGYFLVGTAALDPGQAVSDGHLCLATTGGNLFGRYNVNGTALNSIGRFDAAGEFVNLPGTSTTNLGFDIPVQLPLPGGPMIGAGQTWNFQLWHRESNGLSNFSNGVAVPF